MSPIGSEDAIGSVVRWLAGRVQDDRYRPRVPSEVTIGRKDRELSASSGRAHEEVDHRTLNPIGATEVEKGGRVLVILHLELEIRERTKAISK